jgi:hypothetical protein
MPHARRLASLTLSLAALAAIAAPPPARAQAIAMCPTVTTAEITGLSDAWARGLAAGRLDEVAAQYAEDAVLIAEGVAEPIAGRARIRDYLAGLAGRHAAPRLDMRHVATRCAVATEMAAARFQVTGKRKGTRMFIGGRTSTVWAHDGARWQIVQQSLPTMLVPNRARGGV